MYKFIYVLPIGFLAQYIDGALGMGYGASSSSFLLAAGLMPAMVSASVHMAEIFASLASGISHVKLGNVDKSIVLPLGCAGVVGGIGGAYLLSNVDGGLIKPYTGLLLLAIGIRIFLRFLWKQPSVAIRSRLSKRLLVPLGLIGGVVDAIGGGGWGPVCTTTLVTANRSEPRHVVGSVNASEFFTTLAITATFAFTLGLDKFLWGITVPLIVGGVIAAPIAAHTCRRISPATLGTAIGGILIVLNARTAAPVLSALSGAPVRINQPVLILGLIALVLLVSAVKAITRKQSLRSAPARNEPGEEWRQKHADYE